MKYLKYNHSCTLLMLLTSLGFGWAVAADTKATAINRAAISNAAAKEATNQAVAAPANTVAPSSISNLDVAQQRRQLKLDVRSSINAKRPDDALQKLESQLATPDSDDKADLHMLQGIAWQQKITSNADEKTRREAKQKAELAYTSALQANAAKPGGESQTITTGAVLNNLASLYAQSGEDSKARTSYEQAIASNDPRRGYYALNYAKYLESRDPAKAIPIAKQALAATPTSATAQELVSNLLWHSDTAAMLPFAIQQSDQGFTNSAMRAAIKCLKSGSRPAEEKKAWLVLLARDMAASYAYSADTVDSLRAELASLSTDADIGRGSEQLRAVLQAAPVGYSAMDWWNQQTTVNAAMKIDGRTAMRNLLRAIADANFSRDPKRAEDYLSAALMLRSNHGPDPDTFLRLVELFTNDPVKLKKVMDNYQYEMFTEKGDAYARGDWPLIFRMHLALGMTYAHLGIWKSSPEYQNGIFQLENAQKAADRLNQVAQANNKPERIALPPIAIEKLAEGYAAIGRSDLALTAKVNGASKLQKLGRVNDTNDVLASINNEQESKAPANLKNQINQLRGVPRPPTEMNAK